MVPDLLIDEKIYHKINGLGQQKYAIIFEEKFTSHLKLNY